MVWKIADDKIGIGRSLECSIRRDVKFEDVAIPWSADGYARGIDIIFPGPSDVSSYNPWYPFVFEMC